MTVNGLYVSALINAFPFGWTHIFNAKLHMYVIGILIRENYALKKRIRICMYEYM